MCPQSIAIGHSSYPMRDKTIRDFITASDEATFRFDTQPEKTTRKHAEVSQGQHAKDEIDQDLPVLARKLGIPYLTLLPRKLPQSLQHLVNPKLAHELHCYPLGRERNLKVDNRGSAHRGLAFEAAIARAMGHVEVNDQLDGVRFLASRPYVDSTRVGIYGWSYGG